MGKTESTQWFGMSKIYMPQCVLIVHYNHSILQLEFLLGVCQAVMGLYPTSPNPVHHDTKFSKRGLLGF